MVRTPIRLLVLLAVSFAAIALAVPAQAAAPYCGITWGSAGQERLDPDRERPDHGRPCRPARLLRPAGHRPPRPGAALHVAYVSAVPEDPTGGPVALRGGAPADAVGADHTLTRATYRPGNRDELVERDRVL